MIIPLWMKVLSALKKNQLVNSDHPNSLNKVANEVSMGYGSIFIITNMFREKGFITCVKKGRRLIISFTKQGDALVNSVNKVLEAVNNGRNNSDS